MSKPRAATLLLWTTTALLSWGWAVAADTTTGDWTMRRASRPDVVHLALSGTGDEGRFSHQADWPKSDFPSLDLSRTDTQDANFAITRDAGSLEFEGVLRNGVGVGTFRFVPSARYAADMKALGFSEMDDERQMMLALHDVSVKFAREMKDRKVQDLDADKLVGFRIHNVTTGFVDGLRAAGYQPESDQLIAMKIHGVTLEWLAELQRRGYERIEPDKLIALRIHKVSVEFIDELRKLGYERPAPNELVALRIHRISPEYIEQQQARGIKALTINKLVAMKIRDKGDAQMGDVQLR